MGRMSDRTIIRRSLPAFAAFVGVATLHGIPAASAPSHVASGAIHEMRTIETTASAAAGQPPLTYQTANAPVETAPVVYAIFWGQQWQLGWTDVSSSGRTYTSAQAMQYLTGFLSYIGGTPTGWFGSQTQYCSGVAPTPRSRAVVKRCVIARTASGWPAYSSGRIRSWTCTW